MAVQLDTREVQVQQVNGHGFKSTEGAWLNFSKFARAEDVPMPRVGQRVTVQLDKAGFVRKVEAVAPPANVSASPVASQVPTASVLQRAPDARTAPLAGQPSPDTTIRVNLLQAAVAILVSGGGATTAEEVLALAGRLEVWAARA